MVSSSLLQRMALVTLSFGLLAGCNGSQRFPLVDVGTPPADRQLVERVGPGDRQLLGRADQTAAYAAPTDEAETTTADPSGYGTMTAMRTAQAGPAPVQPTGGYVRDLTTETLEPSSVTETAFVVTDEGINIDAALGVSSAGAAMPGSQRGTGVKPHLVTAQGAMAMAEGQTSQPVVDGIGFDNPTALNAGQSSDMAIVDDAGEGLADGEILPLSVDSGNSGPVETPRRTAAAQAVVEQRATSPRANTQQAGKDCSLFLDKRNCR